MSMRAYGAFLLLTVAWTAVAALGYEVPYGWLLANALVWWGLVVMAIAAAYYVIQEGPAARVTPWLKRDFAINVLILLAVLFAILDGAAGWRHLGLETAGWIAFGAAVLHPLAVDLPHKSHHEIDPAGSPVPQYVPLACLWIDWTLAGILLGALLLL